MCRKMFIPLISFLLILGLNCIHCRNPLQDRRIDPEVQKAIDDFIQEIFLSGNSTYGLGLAIVHNDGELLYTNGYGLADIPKQIPVTNTSQFVLGSVSKVLLVCITFSKHVCVVTFNFNFLNILCDRVSQDC